MGKAENSITRAVMAYLTMHGGHVVRVQSGSFAVGTAYVRGAEPGTADLIGVFRGRAIAVEVKTPKGKQSPSQIAWSERWRASGGIYLVARGIDDVQGLLELRHPNAVH